MNKKELLALPNWVLATLYSEWSEDTYAAGWYRDGEPLFVKAILSGVWEPSRFDFDGEAKIRRLIEETP